MKLLAIDTSTQTCSAALLLEDRVREQYQLAGRRHSELILPMIQQLLDDAGLEIEQLDAIAFGRGPGSFTGIRIAASVVQGIALGANLPVIAVSSLAALAQGLVKDTDAKRILAAFDARMNEVYWAAFQVSDSGTLCTVGDEQVLTPQQVAVPFGETNNWFAVGDGWKSYEPILKKRLGHRVQQIFPERYPRARDVATLAVSLMTENLTTQAHRALPVYLRNQVVQAAGS